MEKNAFPEIHIGIKDIAHAIGDLVVERFTTPYPLEPQQGAEAMLSENLNQDFGYDDMGDWHRVPDVAGRDLEN